MEANNICKFNINRSSDLVCHNFVLETGTVHAKISQNNFYMLGLVTSGTGILSQCGRTCDLQKEMLFAVLRDQPFCICGDGELQYCYIGFSGRRAEELVERVGILSQEFAPQPLPPETVGFWMESLHRANDNNTDLFAEAVLLYSLAQLKISDRPQNDVITQMLALTNDRFTESSFSLAKIGEALGYDVKYLSSLFKKKRGITFTQYLRDLRIRHAVFLMEQGVASVKNIAILSGFDDALYFSKIFKQSEGISPKLYIEKLHCLQ